MGQDVPSPRLAELGLTVNELWRAWRLVLRPDGPLALHLCSLTPSEQEQAEGAGLTTLALLPAA